MAEHSLPSGSAAANDQRGVGRVGKPTLLCLFGGGMVVRWLVALDLLLPPFTSFFHNSVLEVLRVSRVFIEMKTNTENIQSLCDLRDDLLRFVVTHSFRNALVSDLSFGSLLAIRLQYLNSTKFNVCVMRKRGKPTPWHLVRRCWRRGKSFSEDLGVGVVLKMLCIE